MTKKEINLVGVWVISIIAFYFILRSPPKAAGASGVSDAGKGGGHHGGHGGGRRGGGWRGGWSGPDVIVLEDCPVGFYRDEDGNCYPLPATMIARTAAGMAPDASGPLTLTIEHAAGALFNFARGS